MKTIRRAALFSSGSPGAICIDRDYGMAISFGRRIVDVTDQFWPCAAQTRMDAFYAMVAAHGLKTLPAETQDNTAAGFTGVSDVPPPGLTGVVEG